MKYKNVLADNVSAPMQPSLHKARAEAVERLWQLALVDEAVRQELFRSNYVDFVMRMLTTGTCQEQHVSAGLLASMSTEGPHCSLDLLVHRARLSKILPALSGIFLSKVHPRSKVRNKVDADLELDAFPGGRCS
jgi:hypothetical protein